MQIAIVGLARSGKTTVFNTLTRGHAETGGFGGLTVNTGVVKVPDERLSRLTELFKPKREVPADVTYVDLPAPPSSAEGGPSGDIPADMLARLRNADALLHVVRSFGDASVAHPSGSINAWRDIEQLELEFTLADLGVVEKRVEKLRTSGRHGTPQEREANERELEVLERVLPALTEGRPIRDLELADDEQKRIRGFRFLTEKPVLVLLNLGEEEIPRSADLVAEIAARVTHRQTMVEALSARIEMEIGELDEEAAAAFREDLGLRESSLERVIRLSYQLLGLISFFTAGPDETRAWTIPDGGTSVDAAGAIHSDLARGFIRAEVVPMEDLLSLGSMAEARRNGKLRSEGKTYRVKDGDVVEILFNV
ncbi:MAG: ribosome-binding ATPase [Chloroflexota bacterium]|nr:ribosome-binding ATPase [Chloroflexota bacterium]